MGTSLGLTDDYQWVRLTHPRHALKSIMGAAVIVVTFFVGCWPTIASGAVTPRLTIAELKDIGDEAPVGKNLTAEECRLRFTQRVPQRGTVQYQQYRLFCEGWTQPSGEIRQWRVQNPPQILVTNSDWSTEYSKRLYDCEQAESLSLRDGSAATIRKCKNSDGDWPVVVGAVATGNRSYTFESLPTNFALLENAYEVLEGKRKVEQLQESASGISAAIRRMETIVGATGKLIGVQDIGSLYTLKRLGRYSSWAGNRPGAEAAFRRVLEIQERLLGPNTPTSGILLSWLAYELSWQSRFEEADRIFSQAEPLTKKASTGDYAQHLTFLAQHAYRQGKYEEAIQFGRTAAKIRLQTFGRSPAASDSLYRVALGLRALGRLDEAAEVTLESLQNLEGFTARDWEFQVFWQGINHQMLGLIRFDQKRYPEARAESTKGLMILETVFGQHSFRVAESLEILGQVEMADGNTPKALEYFRRAAPIRIKDPVARDNARVGAVAPYIRALLTTADNDPVQREALLAEAFLATQIPRGTETAAALTVLAARLASVDPALRSLTRDFQDSLGQRGRLHMVLGAETLKPGEERDAAREERLKQQVREAEEKVERMEQRLQAEAPRYARLTAARPVPVAEIAPLLKPSEALLMFLPTPSQIFVFLVRDGRVWVHRAALPQKDLEAKIKAVRASLELGDGPPKPFDVATASELYQTLLAPLAEGLTGVTHLLTVPAGPLLSLPLGLLVTKPPASPQSADSAATAWLAREMAISVLPSVTSLVDLRAVATASRAPQPFLGFGDPAFSGEAGATRAVQAVLDVCRKGEGIDLELLRGLPRLRETGRELAGIAQTLGAGADSVVLGAQVTKPAIKRIDLSQYRVIAFATHGLLPGELRCQAEPALALTPPATITPDDNGLLDASDVAQLRLDADWVVLSACNTAGPDGKLSGESLSGLARAFFYAGARTLLVSHWAVASRPTVALTTGLFRAYMQQPDRGRAEALRQAQLTLANDPATAHPVFWAPFVVVGDGK